MIFFTLNLVVSRDDESNQITLNLVITRVDFNIFENVFHQMCQLTQIRADTNLKLYC